MKFYQRVADVIAHEGFIGVWDRGIKKLTRAEPEPQPRKDYQKALSEYNHRVEKFQETLQDIDFPGLDRFLWYHTIDLGDGLITPGHYDYREHLDRFLFPEDMSGMQVLDVGSATGFFAFEFEKRGATVTSVELPTIADWDMPSGEDKQETLRELMDVHKTDSVEELQYLHLDGPFLFCCKMLNSHVNRCYSTIYDLSPEKLNNQQFDMVFIGDVLLHLFSPLQALISIVPLCRGTLIISQTIPEMKDDWPLMLYLGGETRTGDRRTWWYPNKLCFSQMLKRIGFRTVEFLEEFTTIYHPSQEFITKTVIHATK